MFPPRAVATNFGPPGEESAGEESDWEESAGEESGSISLIHVAQPAAG
jgi:hypothetical protein